LLDERFLDETFIVHYLLDFSLGGVARFKIELLRWQSASRLNFSIRVGDLPQPGGVRYVGHEMHPQIVSNSRSLFPMRSKEIALLSMRVDERRSIRALINVGAWMIVTYGA
jgi:hypothetical protein